MKKTKSIDKKAFALFSKRSQNETTKLFDGNDEMFKRLAQSAQCYGEYGCGESTIWAVQNTKLQIYSVDTSWEWLQYVRNCATSPNLKTRWVDCGELIKWGRPASYSKRQNFIVYTDWLWQQDTRPDLVLIDGRFRVCCFLTCLKFAPEGTKIIFDDYIKRKKFHIVEEFVNYDEIYGRQALFNVPSKDKLNMEEIESLIEKFRYVMD